MTKICSCCGKGIKERIYKLQEQFGYTEGAMCEECIVEESDKNIEEGVELLLKNLKKEESKKKLRGASKVRKITILLDLIDKDGIASDSRGIYNVSIGQRDMLKRRLILLIGEVKDDKTCPYCNEEFKSEKGLNIHKRVHRY